MATTTAAALKGSEKQVAWAEKIRAEFFDWQTSQLARSEKELAREQARPNAHQDDVDECVRFVEIDRQALVAAQLVTAASFWIDSRGQTKATVRQMLLQA